MNTVFDLLRISLVSLHLDPRSRSECRQEASSLGSRVAYVAPDGRVLRDASGPFGFRERSRRSPPTEVCRSYSWRSVPRVSPPADAIARARVTSSRFLIRRPAVSIVSAEREKERGETVRKRYRYECYCYCWLLSVVREWWSARECETGPQRSARIV